MYLIIALYHYSVKLRNYRDNATPKKWIGARKKALCFFSPRLLNDYCSTMIDPKTNEMCVEKEIMPPPTPPLPCLPANQKVEIY